GQVGVTRDLPARQVDGLQAGADLLNGHVAGQRTQRVHPLQVVQLGPEDLGAAESEGLLLDDSALKGDNVLGGVGPGDALPTGVGVPVVLDLLGGLRRANGGHAGWLLWLLVKPLVNSPDGFASVLTRRWHSAYVQVHPFQLQILVTGSRDLANLAKTARNCTVSVATRG